MMEPRKMTDSVTWMGAIDWDRRLFDALIPLPDGTSYNAYLIRGSEKTVLLDTVDPTKAEVLLRQLQDVRSIDYIVSHHAEQDHSGAIPDVLERYPEARVITTPKAKPMLIDLLGIDEDRIITVEDGSTISLGDRTLTFIHTPWVHWPETMVTYMPEERILFSGDFFSSHLATTDLYVTDGARVLEAAKRYYAEIMMPFRTIIAKNLAKLEQFDIRTIAPSHGPLYDQPSFIVDAYKAWTSDHLTNIVVLPYISMHGSTGTMVTHLIGALAERGVMVEPFDLAVTDIGKLAIALVDAPTIVVGTPTVLGGPHPSVTYAATLANALRPKTRFAAVIGSYGWGGKAVETVVGSIPNLKVEVVGSVLCKGTPGKDEFVALDGLADTIAGKHREIGVLEVAGDEGDV